MTSGTAAAEVEDLAVGRPTANAAGDELEVQLMSQFAARAQPEGLSLAGEGGLLQRLTKIAVQATLEGEMNAHLGYVKHDSTWPGVTAATRVMAPGPRRC